MRRFLLGLLAAQCALCVLACKRENSKTRDQMLAWKRLDELPILTIELSDEAVASLQETPRKWVEATFRNRETVLSRVGVRLKGHRSMRKLADKPALKLRFDKFIARQTFRGVRRLTMNNMVEDPTMLREVLGYRLYRQLEVPAPAAFYVRLSVVTNGETEDYGLYAVVETIDESFLTTHFADASGGLYEGEYGCDLYVGDVDGFDRDSGDKNGGREDLKRFAEAAAGNSALLFGPTGPIDMKSFLAYLAVSAFIGDFDGYRHAHNYRIYNEPTLGKWFFIPWGIDRSFKQQLSIFESYGLLARRCFADANCRAQYVRVQRDVVRAFEKLNLDEGALALAAFIEPVLSNGNSRQPSAKRINKARKTLLEFIRTRPDSIATETSCIGEDGSEIDSDGDGFGCLDCNDADGNVFPGADEVCDGVDNDCTGAIDDSFRCPTCPILDVGDQQFAVCDLPRPWREAKRYCIDLGGQLATLRSLEQNQAVGKIAAGLRKGRWWLGLNDHSVEGAFVPLDEGPMTTFSNWAKGEPDNHTCNQDCAVLDNSRKNRWHDTHCGQMLPFVCALAPSSKPTGSAAGKE